MKISNKAALYAACAVAAGSLAGCASTPKSIDELDDARAEVQRVESNPRAGEFAAQETERAHNQLLEAEKVMKDGKSLDEVRQSAYLAKRHAQIATEQIAVGEAKETIRKGEAERDQVVAQASAEESQRKAQLLQEELDQLKAQKTDRGYVLTLGDVLFDTGKATLKPGANVTVDRLAKFLQDTPERTVMIEGHTDSVGSSESNQLLSQRRADAVKSALLERGVAPNRIQTLGKGEDYPKASNDNAAGRQQNRRVEVVISETPAERKAGAGSVSGQAS